MSTGVAPTKQLWAHTPLRHTSSHCRNVVQVFPFGTGSQNCPAEAHDPEQQSEFVAQFALVSPQFEDWQMLLMHAWHAVQQVLPAVQETPEAMQAVQVPPTHTWPVAEQQVLPHGVWPWVQTTGAVAQVDVARLAHAVPA